MPRDVVWWVLKMNGMTKGYIDVAEGIYEGANTNHTSIRSPNWEN